MNRIIDLKRFPINAPGSVACRSLIQHCQQLLAEDGALEIPGFLAHAKPRRAQGCAAS